MKHALALFVLAAGSVAAQIPRAEQVDPVLRPDAGNGFFERAKILYDSAQKAADLNDRVMHFQRAAELFSQYLDEFPNHENTEAAWWFLGNSYYQSGSVDDGKRCFSILLNRYGRGKWAAAAAYTLAADHYNKGDYAMAAPLFERYAADAAKLEERPRGNYNAGNCYRFLGRDREAITSYKKVLADPAGGVFVPQTKIALGHLATKAGKHQEALDYFKDVAVDSTPVKTRGEAALSAAQAATKTDQPDVADRYLKMVLTTEGMEDFRADAQTALMANHFAKKDYAGVLDIYRRSAIKADGEKEAARLMIAAKSYMRLKQPSEALGLFRQVERILKPENDLAFEAAYLRLLCFFQIEGRHLPDQVDAFLQIYKKIRPDDERIHTALLMKAETLFANKKVDEAAKVYSEINAGLLGEKNRPGLFYQRGWCLAEAGDPQGAVRSLTEFITKYPQDSRVHAAIALRAKAYSESAEPEKAAADFDRLTGPGVPPDLAAYGWLESARMRHGEGKIEDMILRYKGLLANVKELSESHRAEANYYIGWGLVKTNAAKDAVPFLENSRKLNAKRYGKHAGLALAIGYFAAADPQKLSAEIDLAIKGKYESDIPDQAIQWAGMQCYNAGEYPTAARFLELVSTPEEPRETPKEVWRYLAKARLETGDAKGALDAVNNVLAVEDNPGWKADGLLDRGRALLLLDRPAEARIAADEADALNPQGRTSAGLRILSGDLFFRAKEFAPAGAEFLKVIGFHEDADLKPLSIWKYALVLEQQGQAGEAEKYRQQLQKDFPDWKAPAR